MSRHHRLFALLLKICLVVVYILAIMPQEDLPQLEVTDKFQHAAAFLTLTILACLGMPKTSLLKIVAGLALFGALIELSQLVPPIHRDASFLDWLADMAAIALGLALAAPFRRNSEEAA